MRINNQFNTKKNINFKSNSRNAEDALSRFGYYSQYTSLFRKDIKWKGLANYLIQKYDKVKKVNVYCHACSDGSEPYSLAMALIQKSGEEKAKKFFPIIASDKDPYFFEQAKQGRVSISEKDLLRLEDNIGENYRKYYRIDSKVEPRTTPFGEDYFNDIIFKDSVKNAVIFKEGNIFNDIDSIEADNSLIMCRNMWRYLNDADEKELASKFSKKLGKNSMIMLGEYDLSQKAGGPLLVRNGLEEIPSDDFFAFQNPQNKNITFRGADNLNDAKYLFNVFAKKYKTK